MNGIPTLELKIKALEDAHSMKGVEMGRLTGQRRGINNSV
jgi:hypothetical protein